MLCAGTAVNGPGHVPNDKSNLRYCNGSTVSYISCQGKLELPAGRCRMCNWCVPQQPCRNEVLCIVFLKKAETACTFSLTPTLFFSTRVSYFTSVVGLINVSHSSVQQDSVADGLLFPEFMNVVPERGIGIQQGYTPHGATQTQNALSMSMPRVGFEQTVDCSCLKPPGYCDWVLSNNFRLLWLGHITIFCYWDWVLYNNLQLLWLGLI
jgi:hypothetical protein